MGMDSKFRTSEPVVWLTLQELLRIEDITVTEPWEEDSDIEFEGDRCDTFRMLLEAYLGEEVNCKEVDLTVDALLYIIDKLYEKQQAGEPIRLGFFCSFEHHVGFLRRLVTLVHSSGACTFDCWY